MFYCYACVYWWHGTGSKPGPQLNKKTLLLAGFLFILSN